MNWVLYKDFLQPKKKPKTNYENLKWSTVSKMSQNKVDINIEMLKVLFQQLIHSVIYAID